MNLYISSECLIAAKQPFQYLGSKSSNPPMILMKPKLFRVPSGKHSANWQSTIFQRSYSTNSMGHVRKLEDLQSEDFHQQQTSRSLKNRSGRWLHCTGLEAGDRRGPKVPRGHLASWLWLRFMPKDAIQKSGKPHSWMVYEGKTY